MSFISTFPQPGGFFSASLPPDPTHILRWAAVAMPEAVLAGATPLPIGLKAGIVLNCRGVFIDPRTGGPISWRPLESRIWQAAARLGCLGAREVHPWGTIQRFGWYLAEFHQVVAHELAAAVQQYGCRFIFLDEPAKEDAAGLSRTLRLYGSLAGGKRVPIIANGTFGPEEAPGMVSGRFWQDLPNFYPETAVAETPEDYAGWCHGTPAHGMTPEFLACLASIMGGPYQYTPTNGPFSYDWIPEPFAPGSFGKPLAPRHQKGDVVGRIFENATLLVNVSRDRTAAVPGLAGGQLPPLGWAVAWTEKMAPVAETGIRAEGAPV